MTDLSAPTNVATKYPQPPFKKQQQSGVGTVSEMDPQPDHGEQSYRGSGKLTGRRALITGGDSGIGRAVAIAFAREGASIALNYLPEEQPDADEVASLLRGEGATVELLPGDLTDEAFNAKLVEQTVAALGGIDLLVMVAGGMPTVSGIEDFDTATFDRLLRTNIHSLFWLTKAAKPHFGPGASIIATGSIQSFNPSPDLVEYAVTKAGIANWVRAMAQQLAQEGIRVNGVAPGPFWTPLQPSSVPNDKIESFGGEAAYGRPGQPVELCSTYVYLASQESSYTSGETIVVSGGTPVH
ncbi:SDR family oxidoreductase [uncultured Amnibacterium sp.]|uniref:SDR family oxidoreductase n=1 Tax=uncultured Amnibacterium sp. TaxID=1631851 RepID=UPI0035CBA765